MDGACVSNERVPIHLRSSPFHSRPIRPASANEKVLYQRKKLQKDETLKCNISEVDEDEDVTDALRLEIEETTSASKVLCTLLRSSKLAGVVDGGDKGPHVISVPGHGRGVPPSTRIHNCAVVTSGQDTCALTSAEDGINIVWNPESTGRVWEHRSLLSFWSVFSRFRGLCLPANEATQVTPRIARDVTAGISTATVASYGGGNPSAGGSRKSCFISVQESSIYGSSRASKPPGQKQADVQRREQLRKDLDAKQLQDTYLLPEREEFIKHEMHTTVLHPLDFSACKRAYEELDLKLSFVKEASASAETRFMPLEKQPASANDASAKELARGKDRSVQVVAGFDRLGSTDVEGFGTIPNTPRGLLDMMKKRNKLLQAEKLTWQPGDIFSRQVTEASACGKDDRLPGKRSTASRKTAVPPFKPVLEERLDATPRKVPIATSLIQTNATAAVLPPTPCVPRASVSVTTTATDSARPRLAIAAGDGQIAIYHFFRSFGKRHKELHQLQGFDASRRCGDVATALQLPPRRIAWGQESYEAVLAGFESGRVALYRSFAPILQKKNGGDDSDEARKNASDPLEAASFDSVSGSQPVLCSSEPLLLEHYHCTSPIVFVYWHPILGIFSVGTHGHVVVADTSGAQSFSINAACGRNATVTSADLSMEIEQIAVAGRGVHLWQNLSGVKFGVIANRDTTNFAQSNNVLLVRYLPSMRFWMTVHAHDGEVAIWDARSLEFHCNITAPGCTLASCATWAPTLKKLFIFGSSDVYEIQVEEEEQVKSTKCRRSEAAQINA